MHSCTAGNLSLLRESSDLWTLPLLKCDWQAESREIDISAPDGSSRSGISGAISPVVDGQELGYIVLVLQCTGPRVVGGHV